MNGQIIPNLLQFEGVTEAVDGALCAKYSDVSVVRKGENLLYGRTYNSQNIRHFRPKTQGGQVVLLDSAQGFGTGCVAGENHQRTIVL